MNFKQITCFMTAVLLSAGTLPCDFSHAQNFVIEQEFETIGEIRAVNRDKLTIADAAGKVSVYKIQRKGEQAIDIDGKFLRAPATIQVSGKQGLEFLKPNMIIRFTASLRRGGRSEGSVSEFELIDGKGENHARVRMIKQPDDSKYAQCEVIGVAQSLKKNRLTVLVPNSPYATKNRIRVDVAEDATIAIKQDSLALVEAGDEIKRMNSVKLSTGELIIRSIEIELKQERKASQDQIDKALATKYLKYSDEPSPARDVRSQHFLLHTDVSDRNGQMLLDKLETMIGLVSQYYGRPSRGLIECYVVRNPSNWQPGTFPPAAIEKILEPAGITITRSLGQQRQTVVFSCTNHETVQHEAVHAYCQQTFGSTGPTWYSEGMAEMGAYWKKGQLEVDITPGVISYLTNARPKRMLDIVAAGQVTGDSWQAYAWRWALCHLLANNPNYSSRLKGLGIAMMSGKDASFEATYGDVAPNISFEYDQFVKNFGNGYRADLAAWQWNVKPKRISGSRRATRTISAQRGWQATGVQMKAGESYDLATKGTWQVAKAGADLTADGNDAGSGKLIGVVFDNFVLGETFDLGSKKTLVAKADGQLFLRCVDSWTELSDNSGEITVYIRRTPDDN